MRADWTDRRSVRPSWFAVAALSLPSCSFQSSAVSKCEALLLPTLKAPASYHRVTDLVGPVQKGRQSIVITYDAVNSYNAPLRGIFLCEFDPATGGVSIADEPEMYVDDLSIPVDNATTELPEVKADTGAPIPPKPSTEGASEDKGDEDEVPVCDRPDSPEKLELMNEIGTDCLGE